MGTEVLRPHDVLAERFRFPPTPFHHRRKNNNLTNLTVDKKPYNHQNNTNKKTSPRPDNRKKQQHPINNNNNSNNNVQVKKVTLLRRGESLSSLSTQNNAKQNKEMKLPNRKQPVDDLIMMPKQIRITGPPQPICGEHTYAGSAFSMSPSPRSLPLPSFFNNKQMRINEDPATRDLRRLLRLE